MSSIPFGVPPIPVSASTSLAHSRRFSNPWSQAELTGLPQSHARIPSTEEREPFCIDLRRSQSQGSRANAVHRLVDIVHIEPQSESDDDKYIRQLCARLVDTSVYRQALSEWKSSKR